MTATRPRTVGKFVIFRCKFLVFRNDKRANNALVGSSLDVVNAL